MIKVPSVGPTSMNKSARMKRSGRLRGGSPWMGPMQRSLMRQSNDSFQSPLFNKLNLYPLFSFSREVSGKMSAAQSNSEDLIHRHRRLRQSAKSHLVAVQCPSK